MNYARYNDAVVLPLSPDNRAGVFVEGGCVPSSLLLRHYPGIAKPAEIVSAGDPGPPSQKIPGTAVFAGYLFDHFGHFLLESISRLWITREYPLSPVVWSRTQPLHRGPYLPWQREILELLGVRNEPLFIDGPTEFESIIIPDPGYVISTYFHPDHAAFLAAVDPDAVVPGRHCWVSRSKLPAQHGGTRHEDKLEDRLRSHGWHVFHPEECALTEQLTFLSSSETVAGFSGSAFHSLVLLRGLTSEVKLVVPHGRRNANFATIASVKGFTQRELEVDARLYLPGKIRAQDRLILQNFSDIQDFLDVPIRAVETPKHQTPAARRINLIGNLTSARSYLEARIGDGSTFLSVGISEKTAVDHVSEVDLRGMQSSGSTAFYETTVDEFFTRFSDTQVFDVIYINEVHCFEEALRCFCSTLSASHSRTIWIIGDTAPVVAYGAAGTSAEATSTLPDPSVAGKPRHGDVYKLVLVIHEFFPTFDYVTIKTDDDAQTIVWRSKRRDFVPAGWSIEDVARPTDLDYLADSDVMRFRSEGDALDALRVAVTSWQPNDTGSEPVVGVDRA